jgi:hypothetical protein
MEKEGGRLGLRGVGSRVRSVDGDWNGRGRRRFVRVVGGEVLGCVLMLNIWILNPTAA